MFWTGGSIRKLRIELNSIMYYTVYKITNLLNGKIYIGLHVTEDLDDGYLGSGTQVRSAIKKYGKENFRREYIRVCGSMEEMRELEATLVNEEFVARTDTYNMKTGGTGSWSHINVGDNRKLEYSSRGGKTVATRTENPFKDPEWQRTHNPMNNKEFVAEQQRKANSPEAIAKKKETWKKTGRGKAERNSQFGTCWVTHPELGNKKIKSDELKQFLLMGYTKGRKIIVV